MDGLLVSFCCCHRIKVPQCLTDDHDNADIDSQDKNETDLVGEGSTTCGGAGGFAGTRLTLASLPDGGRTTFIIIHPKLLQIGNSPYLCTVLKSLTMNIIVQI